MAESALWAEPVLAPAAKPKAASKSPVAPTLPATRHTLLAAAPTIGAALPPLARDDASGCHSSFRIMLWQTPAPTRGPDLGQRAFRHQALGTHGIPEWAANCAGIGAAVEHRANNINFACAGVTVLADVAVEAQRSVALAFSQSFVLQKIDREDCRV